MRQTRGIYLISMVAETLDMHPQTLRKYERAGFVVPLRMGTLRTYSDEDVARLRLIKHFVDDMGLNLAGVELALSMTGNLLEMRGRLSRESRSSKAAADSLRQVDQMLSNLGVHVVRNKEAQGTPPQGVPGQAWTTPGSGEAIEMRIPG